MTAATTVEIPNQVTIDGEALWAALVEIGVVEEAESCIAGTTTKPFGEKLNRGLWTVFTLAFGDPRDDEADLKDRFIGECDAEARKLLLGLIPESLDDVARSIDENNRGAS